MTNLSKTIAILGVVAGLGVTALPLSSYAADPTEIEGKGDTPVATKDVPVQLTIDQMLSMYVTTEDGSADVANPVVLSSNADTTANYQADPIAVKVITNNLNGYGLNMAGTYTAESHASDLVNDDGKFIAAGDLTSSAASQWGYKVKTNAGTDYSTDWAAVVDAGAKIDSFATPTGAAGKTTLVKFGAHVLDTQESGVYNGQVTFTATAGASA